MLLRQSGRDIVDSKWEWLVPGFVAVGMVLLALIVFAFHVHSMLKQILKALDELFEGKGAREKITTLNLSSPLPPTCVPRDAPAFERGEGVKQSGVNVLLME